MHSQPTCCSPYQIRNRKSTFYFCAKLNFIRVLVPPLWSPFFVTKVIFLFVKKFQFLNSHHYHQEKVGIGREYWGLLCFVIWRAEWWKISCFHSSQSLTIEVVEQYTLFSFMMYNRGVSNCSLFSVLGWPAFIFLSFFPRKWPSRGQKRWQPYSCTNNHHY